MIFNDGNDNWNRFHYIKCDCNVCNDCIYKALMIGSDHDDLMI